MDGRSLSQLRDQRLACLAVFNSTRHTLDHRIPGDRKHSQPIALKLDDQVVARVPHPFTRNSILRMTQMIMDTRVDFLGAYPARVFD